MLEYFLYFSIFVFGLTIGSFLNCVIYRLEQGQSFLRGRSFCPHCKHKLGWQDLVPVLSFVALRGKCRYCQKQISWQYPLVEIATGILFVLIFNQFSPNGSLLDPTGQATISFLSLIYYWAIFSLLVAIFVFDLKHFIIPDEIVFPAIITAFIFNLLRSDLQWRSDLVLPAFGAAAFFLAIVLVSQGRWMGVGDIKLAFFMGLFLGWPNILAALFLAFLMGALAGIGLIAFGKKTLKSEVPFGPFLITGTFLALFFGERIINWYLGMFLSI